MAEQVIGVVYSIGLANGILGVNDLEKGVSHLVKASEPQRAKMFPSLHVGDKVKIWKNEDDTIRGGITVLERAKVEPAETKVTPHEERIEKQTDREKSIIWQTCLKAAVEIEKLYVGDGADRNQTVKEVIVVTNSLFEATMRKLNGLPAIPETRES